MSLPTRDDVVKTPPVDPRPQAGALVVLTFASTHRAIAAEETLLARGLPFQVIPVPEWIRSGCGLALRFSCDLLGPVQDSLAQAAVPVQGVHYLH